MSNYKRCDCCGQLKPEEELEEATITIKKCASCDISKAPILNEIVKPELRSLGERPLIPKDFNSYKTPPAALREAFKAPPVI
jgi:hypothetical protein